MKKAFLLFIFNLVFLVSFAQTIPVNRDSLATYAYGSEDVGFKVSINENGDLQFVKIIDSLSLNKEVLFSKVLSYFAYNYKDSKNVLQQQDKENGLILAKGNFGTFSNSSFSLKSGMLSASYFYSYNADHIVRVDIKENRLRYILTISDYMVNMSSSNIYSAISNNKKSIIKSAPFFTDLTVYGKLSKNTKKYAIMILEKTQDAEIKAFKDLCNESKNTIDNFEKSIKEGSSKAEANEW